MIRIGEVEIGHPIGQVRDDARSVLAGLADYFAEIRSVIRVEPFLIAVLAGSRKLSANRMAASTNSPHEKLSQPT